MSCERALERDDKAIGRVRRDLRVLDVRQSADVPRVLNERVLEAAAGADPDVEYVSAASPLGKALLGKRKSGSVEIKTSLGKQNYGILRIA